MSEAGLAYTGAWMALTLILGAWVWRRRILSPGGAAMATGMALVIGLATSPAWLVLLLVFLLVADAATRWRLTWKRTHGLAEGKRGTRRASSVLANGIVPLVIAILTALSWWEPEIGALLFLTALSAAGADTIASEVGVFGGTPRMITTGRKVPKGTNGGITLMGNAAALAAAMFISGIGILVLAAMEDITLGPIWVLPVLGGFIGCQIDSVLGGTLENAGYLGKDSNNVVSITLTVLLTWVALVVLI